MSVLMLGASGMPLPASEGTLGLYREHIPAIFDGIAEKYRPLPSVDAKPAQRGLEIPSAFTSPSTHFEKREAGPRPHNDRLLPSGDSVIEKRQRQSQETRPAYSTIWVVPLEQDAVE